MRNLRQYPLTITLAAACLFCCPANRAAAQLGNLQQGKRPSDQQPELQGYEFRFPAMGTLVVFQAYARDEERVSSAFDEAKSEVLRLASLLTDYDPSSETRRLSRNPAGRPTKVSNELWSVLQASDQWQQRTGGAFDSSLGQLTLLWRKYRRANRVPDRKAVSTALEQCGWQHVELLENRQVRLDPDVRLDFGGIGKGWIIDQAYESLVAAGLTSCLVNISGNMRLGAPPPGRRGWRVEIAGLKPSGKPLRRFEMAYTSMATSGDLWQSIVVEGIRRSHILDPQSGYGVPGPVSATILTQLATDADAMATAACILPTSTTRELADKHDFDYVIARYENGQTRIVESPELRKIRLPLTE